MRLVYAEVRADHSVPTGLWPASQPTHCGTDQTQYSLTHVQVRVDTQMDAELVAGAAAGVVAADTEPPNPIHGVLTTCGIMTASHRDVFINIEGLNSISAFPKISGDTDVTETRPNAAAGRVILGTLQIKRLQALVFWVKDYDKRGMETALELWMEDVMNKQRHDTQGD